MTTITLTKMEQELAVLIAKERHFSNRRAGNKLIEMPNMDAIAADILGVESEMAVYKMLGLYPENIFDVTPRSVTKGEDNGDVQYNGKNIDVKSTTHHSGTLLATKANPNVDVLILMTGKDGEYVCRGGTTAKEMYKQERYGDNNGKFKYPCFYMVQSELVDYKKLLDIA